MADPVGVGDIWLKPARHKSEEDRENGGNWTDKGLHWAPREHAGKGRYTSIASHMTLGQMDLEEERELPEGGHPRHRFGAGWGGGKKRFL